MFPEVKKRGLDSRAAILNAFIRVAVFFWGGSPMKTKRSVHQLILVGMPILIGLVLLWGSVTTADAQSANDGFDPNANNNVYSIAVQSDGKILIGADFTQVGGQARNRIARLTNTNAAFQDVSVGGNGSMITWMRSGAGPELWRAIFEESSDGTNWSSLGEGIRISGGWRITGLSLPRNQKHYVRGRGHAVGGVFNASGSLIESVRNIYLAKGETTTALASSQNPSVFGQWVTFTATVNESEPLTPTGTVTFKEGAATLGTGTLNGSGQATFTINTLSIGTHDITAEYGGDANFNGSTSSALAQTVNKASTTTTITSDNPDPSVVGQAVTVNFTVTVNPPGSGTPTGDVTVSDGTINCTGPLVGGAGSCNLSFNSAGGKALNATYGGDAYFNGSASSGVSHTVNKAAATITLSNLSHTYDGTPKSATATTNPPTLVVDITYNGSGTLPTNIGSYAVVATIRDANYEGTAIGTLVIARANTTTAVVSSKNPSLFSEPVTVTATVSPVASGIGTPTGTVTFKNGATVLGTVPLSGSTATLTISSLPAGDCPITAEYGGDEIFDSSISAVLTQTVNPFDLVLVDEYGRAELRVNTLTGEWSYTILTGSGAGNTYTGTGRIVRRGEIFWLFGLDSEGWGLNLVYNETFKKGTATFGDRATGVRSSMIVTGP